MKFKILLALAACVVSAAATAQMPPPPPRGPGPGMDRPHMSPRDRMHRPRKMWVPAHREHGRWVRGRYVWR